MQSWYFQDERRPANVTVPWDALVNNQRTAFWGRSPLLGTQQQQPSLVLLQVYLPNGEINSEYFMSLITPPCM